MRRGNLTKWTLVVTTGIVVVFGGMRVWLVAAEAPTAETTHAKTQGTTIQIPVKGMTCGMCELGVEKPVAELPGVMSVDAQAGKEQVVVTYDPARVSVEKLIQAINKTGFLASEPVSKQQ